MPLAAACHAPATACTRAGSRFSGACGSPPGSVSGPKQVGFTPTMGAPVVPRMRNSSRTSAVYCAVHTGSPGWMTPPSGAATS